MRNVHTTVYANEAWSHSCMHDHYEVISYNVHAYLIISLYNVLCEHEYDVCVCVCLSYCATLDCLFGWEN